ncbi:hypothetical protein AALA80_09060 [Oscillospiraceae bacterium 50-60]
MAKPFDAAKKPFDLIALFVQFAYHSSKDFFDCVLAERLVYNRAPLPKPSSHLLYRPDPSEEKPDRQPDQAAAKEHSLPDHRRSFRQTTKRLPRLDQMRRPYEVWYSICPVFSRWTGRRFFSKPQPVRMNLDAGGIQTDHIRNFLFSLAEQSCQTALVIHFFPAINR